jgi:tol-pal system protein YbgF
MNITRTLAVLGLSSALLLAGGCATSSDMEKLQSQISDLQDQVAQLKRTASSKEEVQNVNSRIAEQTQTLLKSNATLVAKVGEIEEKMNNAQGTVEQTNYRIDRLVQQVTQAQHDVDEVKAQAAARAAAVIQPGPPAPDGNGASMSEVTVAPPATTENPLEVYQAAYRDYQRGNYDLAIGGFRDFLSRNASSDLADNASYWVGESLFSQKKYREAIQEFDSVVTKYPKSDKVPGALLKKGYAYISLNEKAQGIVQLQYVVHEHPQSQEAALARQKLKQLGVETR